MFVKVLSDEFDLTVCQELAVEHGFLVPMNLWLRDSKDGWPVAAVPLQVMSSSTRCPTRGRCYSSGKRFAKGRARV